MLVGADPSVGPRADTRVRPYKVRTATHEAHADSVDHDHCNCRSGGTRARASGARPAAFRIVEATIPQMRDAIASGRLTSRQLVAQYLTRIGLYEDRLHAAIVVNPRALDEAAQLDRER